MDQVPKMTPSLKYIAAAYSCFYSKFQGQNFDWNFFFISENETEKSQSCKQQNMRGKVSHK